MSTEATEKKNVANSDGQAPGAVNPDGGERLTGTITLAPNPANKCFGCGAANPAGMHLTFVQDNDQRKIIGRFILGERYQGGGGMGHGGIIATLMDEAMGKIALFRNVRAVTAELTVQFLKPVRVDEEIIVEAYETEQKGRSLFHVGEIRNLNGDVLARGRGRFVIIEPK